MPIAFLKKGKDGRLINITQLIKEGVDGIVFQERGYPALCLRIGYIPNPEELEEIREFNTGLYTNEYMGKFCIVPSKRDVVNLTRAKGKPHELKYLTNLNSGDRFKTNFY